MNSIVFWGVEIQSKASHGFVVAIVTMIELFRFRVKHGGSVPVVGEEEWLRGPRGGLTRCFQTWR